LFSYNSEFDFCAAAGGHGSKSGFAPPDFIWMSDFLQGISACRGYGVTAHLPRVGHKTTGKLHAQISL
jgi:hypothetical protein